MKMWSSSATRTARHEQRGHDHAIEYIHGMLEQQRRIVDETPRSNPSWDEYRAQLTVLTWAFDGLVEQSTAEFGTDPGYYDDGA